MFRIKMLTNIVKKIIEREIVTNKNLEEQILPLRSEIGALRFEVREQMKLRKNEIVGEMKDMLSKALAEMRTAA
jgi:hypothetical protein